MGIKHVNPWWFRLLSSHFSCLHQQNHHRRERPRRTLKIINCDGQVKIYDRPVQVAELLNQFPKHMICRSDSFYIGQKIPPLSKDDKLRLGHNYFLLPQQVFQTALSFVTIASFANARYSKKAAACQPFQVEKSESGCLRIRVSDEFISELMEESKMKDSGEESCSSRVCTTPQLQKQYALLVGSSRHNWKPKLETIKEKKKKRRKKIWAFGLKRKNKTTSKKNVKSNHRSAQHHHHVDVIGTCEKPQSKHKIKIKSSRKS
ncbi:slr0305 protein [Hibiscus syriacus]|uniref:Slr0305 protein n=2 Tax=Hibiscus syriacus TaxID=106335 RepID=A0A6A3AA12_HIBSY|nr:slr0305 protein [Hibiscus syriacus]